MDCNAYLETISNEFMAIKNNARNLIGVSHYPTDGAYKERILIDFLKRRLSQMLAIQSGFVLYDDRNTSTQIDIIVYHDNHPLCFMERNFVTVHKDSVLGIIEVQSRLTAQNTIEAIDKISKIKRNIGKNIFSGIFAFESGIKRGLTCKSSKLDEC